MSFKTLSIRLTCQLKGWIKYASTFKINTIVTFLYHPDYDAFIILHGTDTLSYTASALSFMV